MKTDENCPTIFGVILAGGAGTRFWPLSRSEYPKQVLRLMGLESMIQGTINRLLPLIPPNHLKVITNVSQEDVIRLELYQKGWEDIELWLEPQGKNTAAAIGLAAARLQPLQEDSVMAVFPADHYIEDQQELLDALKIGARWAQDGYLVTLGIPPTRPATGFGYIKTTEKLDDEGKIYQCLKFTEKPDLPQAQAFLAEGNYYWNSGIFIFQQSVILRAFSQFLPELYDGFMTLQQNDNLQTLTEVYNNIPNISIDFGILERSDNVVVVPVGMGWSDVGTWGAAYELFPKDKNGNVITGRTLDRNSNDSFIFSQDRLVGTIGLNKMIVVDTPDATLICPRDRVQEVKELVAELQEKNFKETKQHLMVHRPWGNYTVMDSGPGYKVKQIVVAPGKRLSLQMHNIRAEHWVVVQGRAQVTIGTESKSVVANESIFVPPKTAHRLENLTAEPVKIIEVQTGSYLEEDDIVRLDDDYWRLPGEAMSLSQS